MFVIEGLHDGMVKARRYFLCRPGHGIFTTASQIRFIPVRRWYVIEYMHLTLVDVVSRHYGHTRIHHRSW